MQDFLISIQDKLCLEKRIFTSFFWYAFAVGLAVGGALGGVTAYKVSGSKFAFNFESIKVNFQSSNETINCFAYVFRFPIGWWHNSKRVEQGAKRVSERAHCECRPSNTSGWYSNAIAIAHKHTINSAGGAKNRDNICNQWTTLHPCQLIDSVLESQLRCRR